MAVTRRLQETVASRLGALDHDLVDLMEVVAHSEPTSGAVLERLFTPGTLAAAERRGVVSVTADGRRIHVRLAHPLYGETARARCPTLRTRAIHRDLAAALEATGTRRSEDVLRLATYRLASGEPGRPDVLLAGAQRAMAVFDLGLAERLARAALDAGGGVAAKLAIAHALVDTGRGAEAAELLGDLDDAETSEPQRTAGAVLRAYGTWMGLGQPGEAERILIRAHRTVGDPMLRDDLQALRVPILNMAGWPREANAVAAGIFDRPGASERSCVRAAVGAVMGHAVAGSLGLAVATAERWVGPAQRVAVDLPFAADQLRGARAYGLCLAG
jgi:hypothetical protein